MNDPSPSPQRPIGPPPLSRRLTKLAKSIRPFHVVVAVFVVLVIAASIVTMTRDKPRPGQRSVYERIDAETDCGQLQREFDTASSNHTRDLGRGRTDLAEIDTSYMEAAHDRMEEIGCR